MKGNNENREYVLRFRPEGTSEDEYIPITEFNISEYKCGLKAGDRVVLKIDLPIYDEEGESSDRVYKSGEIWTVLTGAEKDPTALWLRQEDGCLHSWDDDASIFDTFELIKEPI